MSEDSIDRLFPHSLLEGITPPEISSPTRKIWRITDLLGKVQDRLDLYFDTLWVEGEISNLRRPSSGHYYFTLKDMRSQIRVVLFRSQAARLCFDLEDGKHVICLGRINIYAGRGDLQLVADFMESKGEGALQLAFERLKAQLTREGLFSPDHKVPIPFFPHRVFVITSPSGAAIRDFIRTARGRCPGAEIVLCPSTVQGEGAYKEIIAAMGLAQQVAAEGDVILLTRGGGSIEDLWAFNNEALAHAIFDCPIPVVSAVGHEIDFTISDFVADQRAATPTAAGQLLFPSREELMDRLGVLFRRMTLSAFHTIELKRHRVQMLMQHLKDPKRKLVELRLHQDDLNARLLRAMQTQIISIHQTCSELHERLVARGPERQIALARATFSSLLQRLIRSALLSVERKRNFLAVLSKELDAVSPLAVLARGYSLVYRVSNGEIVKGPEQVTKGEELLIRPEKGSILCKVLSIKENRDKMST
ncbi:MAG: exodeoxyribonuclease VII large subunit [Nitrospiraceae bacterium]|nr:exodeoxyribonuclease VII large subunit [Nitrospiraceae bacterium]